MAENTEIIDSVEMVGMAVGKQNGIDLGYPIPQCLDPELRPYINKDFFRFTKESTASETIVPRIGRTADLAATPDDRNTMACTGSQQNQFHILIVIQYVNIGYINCFSNQSSTPQNKRGQTDQPSTLKLQ